MALDSFSRVVLEISATSDKLVHEVGKANKSLGLLGKTAAKISTTFQGILIGRGVYEIIQGFGSAISTLAEFDKSMTQVKVITGATNEEFRELEESALKLGSSTQYTAKQVADLQLEFGRLGFSTKEILNATTATVDLATATGESLARSAEIAGSTLRAFGLDSKQMTRVTDAMATALNESALTLDSFADGIKYVAPVAAASNISLEETAAMLSVLADAGIKGSQAGTSLRRIFTLLTKDGKPLQERMAELAKQGITLAGANDEVGLYAQTALLVLERMLPTVNNLTQKIKDNTGSTKEMARAMEDNLATSITKAKTAWDAFILSLRGSNGFISGVVKHIRNVLVVAATDKETFNKMGISWYDQMIDGFFLGINPANAQKYANQIEEFRNRLTRNFSENTDKTFSIRGLVTTTDAKFKQQIQDKLAADEALIAKNEEARKKQEELNKEYQESIRLLNELGNAENKRLLTKAAVRDFGLGAAGRSAALRASVNAGNTPVKEPVDTPTSIESEIEKLKELQFNYAEVRKRVEELNETKKKYSAEESQRLSDFTRSAEQIGDSITRVIAADESLGKSVAAVTATIVEELERQALAYILANAAKMPNPMIAIAAAVAGFSVLKGLFAKISKGKSGSSANVGQGYTKTYTPSYMSNVSFEIRGQNLYGVLQNYQNASGFTKG